MTNSIIISQSHNPWHNLALEEYLFDHLENNSRILYLWQNDHTVVIGKSQNSWKECRVSQLEADGGYLARRTSGGGAVYHDLGNLCYTFMASSDLYSKEEYLTIILSALESFGIKAGFTGRNDISLDDGRKFSGNAFRFVKDKGLMHGTLLVNTDFEKMSKYLSVSKAKMEAKGVSSVRSRTVNLKEINPDIAISGLSEQIKKSFQGKYGYCNSFTEYDIIRDDSSEELDNIRRKHASWEWRLGLSPAFDVSFEKRFSWGEVDLHFNVRGGKVDAVQCFTDSMEPDLGYIIQKELEGIILSDESIRDCVRFISNHVGDSNIIDCTQLYTDLLSWFLQIF